MWGIEKLFISVMGIRLDICICADKLIWSISIKAEGSTAKINIIVKPRDSNEVLSQNTNDFSKNSWDYEKNSIYGVVKQSSPSDYSFGVVPVPDGSQPWNNDHDLHMRFNEVEKTTKNPWTSSEHQEHSYGTWNTEDYDGANNHLRFNEVENESQEDSDIHTWPNNDYVDNTIHWSPYGDVSDYPNNQAKSKVCLWLIFHLTKVMKMHVMHNPSSLLIC